MSQCKECSKLLIPLCTSCFRGKILREKHKCTLCNIKTNWMTLCVECTKKEYANIKRLERVKTLKEVFDELEKLLMPLNLEPESIVRGIYQDDLREIKQKLETK